MNTVKTQTSVSISEFVNSEQTENAWFCEISQIRNKSRKGRFVSFFLFFSEHLNKILHKSNNTHVDTENNTKANGAKNEKHKKIQQLKIQMLTWVNKAAANFTKLTTVGCKQPFFLFHPRLQYYLGKYIKLWIAFLLGG